MILSLGSRRRVCYGRFFRRGLATPRGPGSEVVTRAIVPVVPARLIPGSKSVAEPHHCV
jgi:hypothetical protein